MEHLENWEQKPNQSGKENEQDLVEKEFFPENLKIDIFRHGQAKYLQLETGINQADDLTPEGIREVRTNAEKLTGLIKDDEEVVIWSSPLGRTLHTAKIITEVLREKGIKLRPKKSASGEETLPESVIKVFKTFSEVKGFSWKMYYPLVEGGEVAINNKKFLIDKKETNPENLNSQLYYLKGAFKKISPAVKEKWPLTYRKIVENFEELSSATQRIIHPLQHLKKMGHEKPYRVIIVTHEALTVFLAQIYSGGKAAGIEPGDFINLERKDETLVVTQVGDLPRDEESANRDVITSFEEQKEKNQNNF